MRVFFIFFLPLFLSANSLQDAIDRAKPYSVIKLAKGVYQGNFVINKPLTIAGDGNETILDGKKRGSVITINSKDVTIKNLTILGSGHRKENFDSAITAKNSDNLTIQNCTIKDALYGIYLIMSNHSKIINNHISSKDEKIPLRGDALKLWYSNYTTIKGNTFYKARDINLARSNNNLIENNRFLFNRFSSYIEMGKNNIIRDNYYKHNEVSIMMMGAQNVKVLSNKILSSSGVAGIGIVLKGGKNIEIKDNIIKYNAKAVYIDNKPNQHALLRTIEHNLISFNLEALHFHVCVRNNKIVRNIIDNNLEDIVRDISGYETRENLIEYNFWGQYRGFDRNNDDIGDTPYIKKVYLDKLWSYNPKIKFFYASVVIELANFLCEIAPFSEPLILLEDKKPLKIKPKWSQDG